MRNIIVIAVAAVAIFFMGCYNPILEPLPTYTPYPTPEARVVVVTPTPVPDEGWTCFTGKVELVKGTDWDDKIGITIIGEQILCAKEWKISNTYGPVGSLESNPDTPLTFRDLNKAIKSFKNPTKALEKTHSNLETSQ